MANLLKSLVKKADNMQLQQRDRSFKNESIGNPRNQTQQKTRRMPLAGSAKDLKQQRKEINELENRAIEIKSKTQRENRVNKAQQNVQELGTLQ